MKIISWNVNGIRAILKKGFEDAVKKMKPDIICLQETKAHPDQVDTLLEQFPYHYWNASEKKGYSSTAIFSKVEPLSVHYGDDKENHKGEGRIIVLEFKKFYLVTVYTPNSGAGLRRLDYRKKWDASFLKHMKKLEKKKPVVLCGDLNVAHTEIDLAHPKANYNKTAGYTQTEIDGLENYLKHGFIDTFREFNKKPKQYSYWSYRFNARKNNVGWRIDYFMISKKLRPKLKDAFILKQYMGSDHCPVGIDLDI